MHIGLKMQPTMQCTIPKKLNAIAFDRKAGANFSQFVEEGNLSRNISTLRTALNETPGDKFIETVPKRGYRFVATVRDVAGNTVDPAAKIATPRLDLEETDLTSATLQPDAKMTAVDAAEIEVGSTAAAGQPATVTCI